jgi:hypothetical protein
MSTTPQRVSSRPESQTSSAAQEREAADARIRLLSDGGGLNDEFIRSLEITPSEERVLRSALAQAQSAIERLSLSHATVDRQKGLLGIKVVPFEGGADVYDGLMSTFEVALGKERYAAISSSLSDELERAFYHFGAEWRSIVITPSLYGGAGLVDIRDYGKTSSSDRPPREVRSTDLANLPAVYQWLAPLVSQGIDRKSGEP